MGKREFWIINTSTTRDVSLGDLRLTIRRGESRNLLDSRHYSYTEEQLEKSAKTGSIYAKRNVIKIRDIRPSPVITPGKYVTKGNRITRLETKVPVVKIEEPHYDDIDFLNDMPGDSDEKFAMDDANFTVDDHTATLMPGKSDPKQPIKKNKK